MAAVMVCPNCRSQLSPCLSVACPVVNPSIPPCETCQRCTRASSPSTPCLAAGSFPNFPLPYVCRHWLQVSGPSLCSQNHPCSGTLPTTLVSNPLCQAAHQSNPKSISTNGSTATLQVNGPCSGATVKFPADATDTSHRSVSPEGQLVLPDILFTLSGFTSYPALQKAWTSEDDKRVLESTMMGLQASGWYFGAMTWQEAAALLANKPEGTFLVRDSSSKQCPFALSVQTPQGPTSIRIKYEEGKFWLDCEKKGVTPQLSGVMELVQYYRNIASDGAQQCPDSKVPTLLQSSHSVKDNKHVWIDHTGRVFSPIHVVSPLKKNPSSLKHLCRLTIHSNRVYFPDSDLQFLPSTLLEYLKQYQYSL